MSNLIPLASFSFEPPPVPAKDHGKQPRMEWLPLSKLRIDDSYQRPIDGTGRKTIRGIIENFSWNRFSPLVVAPRPGGLYAIVDGQHRAVACALHGGIKEVPCHILSCSAEEEAGAFATINGIVTRMHPQYLFRARIASGDKWAVAANEAAKAAGVKILAYPVAASLLKVGETLAGRTIELELQRVGRDVLVASLELISRTGSGNAGLVRAAIIEAFDDVYSTHPKWLANQDECRRVVHRESVRDIYTKAMRRQADGAVGSLRSHIAAILSDLLAKSLGDGGQTANPLLVERLKAKNESRKGLAPAAFRKKEPNDLARVQEAHRLTEQRRLAPAAPPRPKVDDQTLIQEHIAKHGVRRFDTADTADDYNLCEWMRRRGFDVIRNTGRGMNVYPFRVNDKPLTREQFFALINSERKKENLPPIGAVQA